MNQQQINEKVAKDEELGRILFLAVCKRERWCKPHKFSKDKMARWDVSFFADNQPIVADIKKRRYEATTFENWYFEVDKANELIKLAKNSKNEETKIGYIHLFADNIMWVWIFDEETLRKIPTGRRECPINDWSTETVLKEVYLLPSAFAKYKEEIDLTKSIFKK